MENSLKRRIISGVAAIVVASVVSTFKTEKAEAETVAQKYTPPSYASEEVNNQKKYKPGTFIDEILDYEESQYKQYVVKNGDNISKISRKICKYYNEDPTTKYWPVLAFLNGFPKVIHEGDVLVFPGSFEDMVGLWQDLDEMGWIKRYVRANDVYGNSKRKDDFTIGDLLAEIYGDEVCTDPDFVDLYLEAHGLKGQYNIDTIVKDYDGLFSMLTEWLPSVEELEEYRVENPLVLKK